MTSRSSAPTVLSLDLTPSLPPQGVLERVALTLNSTLELRDALRALAQITLEETDGDRSTVFLLEDRRLIPAAAIGTQADVDLWPVFRSMGEIDLDEIPGAWELCADGRALRVDDAQGSQLIPREWAERFCLRSVVLVPLSVAGEPGGLMVVDYRRPNLLSDDQVRLLEAIASYAGVAVRNARLFETTVTQLRNLEEARRERALATERERIAEELHDTAGQVFLGIHLLCKRYLEEVPSDSLWSQRIEQLVELSEAGKWEIDQAVRALAVFPSARGGIAPALRALANTFSADSSIDVIVDVQGEPVALPPNVDRALYRVAHESLVNSWAHARCSSIRIQVSYEEQGVALSIVDDGIGLTATSHSDGPRSGLMAMRRAMEEVDGSLRVRDARPLGVRIEARAPRGSQ